MARFVRFDKVKISILVLHLSAFLLYNATRLGIFTISTLNLNLRLTKNQVLDMKKTALLIALTTFGIGAAQAEGFVKSSDGTYVKSTYDSCLNQKYFKEEVPACDPELAARLEAERLAAEKAKKDAADAAARAAAQAEADRLAKLEAERRAAAARVIIESVKNVTLSANTSFAVGKAVLSPAGQQELSALAGKLQSAVSEIDSIKVGGHTDSTGSKKLNQRLSQQRADAVKNYLVSQGISANLITATGYGPDHPVASNKTAKGRAENRRSVIEVQAKAQVKAGQN